MGAAAAAGDANPRAGGGTPGTSRPRANKTQTKHYVKGRRKGPPFFRRPAFLSRPHAARAPHAGLAESQVALRTGRGRRTEARVGEGTRRPDAGDEGAPRAHPSACTPARPGLAAPPPRKMPRAPPAPPRSRACALAASRARFKLAASPATACSGPRGCLIRGALDPFGREGNRSLSPSQNSNFPRPLPVPLELVKHVFPRTPLPASQAGPRCAFPPLPRCHSYFFQDRARAGAVL